MKKTALGLTAALLCCTAASAHPPITVYVDGQPLSFDQPPILQDDRTLVPMRGIFQALGATVSWDEPSQSVTAMTQTDVIVFRVGDAGLYKNGDLVYTMPVTAQIINDRLLVPLRAIAQSMGAQVSWDEIGYTITILSADGGQSTPRTDAAAADTQEEPQEGGFFAEIKAADGTAVLTVRLECDTVSTGKAAAQINQTLAAETFALGQGFLREYQAAALAAYEKLGDAFLPYCYIGSYQLTAQTRDAVSFFATATIYDGEKETRSYHSETYDLAQGGALRLSDLISDGEEELEQLYLAGFGAMIAAEPKGFYTDAEVRLGKNLDKVDFYLSKDGIVFYLPPGVIAPTAAGVVAFAVEYEI